MALEEEFNEQWFDVFLYYALIGLSNQETNIRVYSLSILTSIARFNCESMLDITERVDHLANESFWEVKAQCLEFACVMLTALRTHSHLLAVKDEIKSTSAGGKEAAKAAVGNVNVGADRNKMKTALQLSIEIVKKCFNTNSPKSV